MKLSQVVNLALNLFVTGLSLTFFGVSSQLLNRVQPVLRTTIYAHRQTSAGVLFLGIGLLLASLWLSGYAFSQTR